MTKTEDGLKYCQFLIQTSSGDFTINTSHKYSTQIVSTFAEYIPLTKTTGKSLKQIWKFFLIYVSPAFLCLKPLPF